MCEASCCCRRRSSLSLAQQVVNDALEVAVFNNILYIASAYAHYQVSYSGSLPRYTSWMVEAAVAFSASLTMLCFSETCEKYMNGSGLNEWNYAHIEICVGGMIRTTSTKIKSSGAGKPYILQDGTYFSFKDPLNWLLRGILSNYKPDQRCLAQGIGAPGARLGRPRDLLRFGLLFHRAVDQLCLKFQDAVWGPRWLTGSRSLRCSYRLWLHGL